MRDGEFLAYSTDEHPSKGPSRIGLTNYLELTFSIVDIEFLLKQTQV